MKYIGIFLFLNFCLFPLYGLDLARDGKACVVIVTGQNPSSPVLTASAELAKYLKAMTGATFIVKKLRNGNEPSILLGTPYPEASVPDEVRIRVKDPSTLELTGEGPRGTLYAVFGLLEDFGVRYWAWDHETVPKKETLSLPDDYDKCDKPALVFRECSGESLNYPLWRVKLRFNRGVRQPFLGGEAQFDCFENLTVKYLKWDKYWKIHPEFFTWYRPLHRYSRGDICYTNYDSIPFLIEDIREQLKETPDMKYVSISQPDAPVMCQCEQCKASHKKYEKRGTVLRYVIRAARAVGKEFPNLKVIYLSYATTMGPPRDTSIRLEPNMEVCCALYWRDYAIPISNPKTDGIRMVQAWQKHPGAAGNRSYYVWDYNANFGNYMVPCVDLDLIPDALRCYRDNNVKGVLSQFPFGSLGDFIRLKTYLFGKMAWNPDLDPHVLIKEYCEANYGKATPYVLQYIERLQACRDARTRAFLNDGETKHWLKGRDIVDLYVMFEKAFDTVKDSPDDAERLKSLHAFVLFVTLERWKEVEPEAKKAGVKLDYTAILMRIAGYVKNAKNGGYCSDEKSLWDYWRNWEALTPRKAPNIKDSDALELLNM